MDQDELRAHYALKGEGRGAGGLKAKVFQDVPIQLVLLVHYKHQVGRFAGVFSRQQVVISLDIWRFLFPEVPGEGG